MKVTASQEAGMVLCQALGLDPNQVTEITIRWEAGTLPYAEVRLYLNEEAVYRIIQLRPTKC